MGSGSEFQVVSAANENDLQPYFFNFANDIVRSLTTYKNTPWKWKFYASSPFYSYILL